LRIPTETQQTRPRSEFGSSLTLGTHFFRRSRISIEVLAIRQRELLVTLRKNKKKPPEWAAFLNNRCGSNRMFLIELAVL
jgi:hypothetical protein